MANEFLASLGSQDCPGTILGVVISATVAKPACKVKFSIDSDLDACAAWLKKKFCAWSKLMEMHLKVTQDAEHRTVEITG